MGIFDKIDQIRQKPEHIRMRYVLLCVGISMFFVIIFWIFSMQNQPTPNNTSDTSGILEQFSQQKETLDDIRQDYQANTANNNSN
jgi:uncharacterized protein YpmS